MIEFNGALVIRSIIPNEEFLSNRELLTLKDIQIKNVLCADIQGVWLQRFNVLLDRSSMHRTRVYQGVARSSPREYRMFISTGDKRKNHTANQIPVLEVEIV